ncbi:excinuclease ABC subunit C [Candidatus Uhrbacteria bacterium RIFCSPLOWO2_02_FULL_51_9]|uniref:Excinuclease ABC subunit C n=1 Tax=Candidatus Uhrbacteria bacterium RIFCSPLOWO2_02_FULL_51_9 TaxID=1802410 RepID=A0A1F7VFS3_9BACT|nr:MAG: excinuclease ABC subunit C [Candidatus Uhrbacteria bacterium RIFCSPLOWO2_02_FULL_51_9]
MGKQYYVYIATNQRSTVLYTGVTNNIHRRAEEHHDKLKKSFTARYNVNKIVYFEVFNDPEEAIIAEKKIKGGSREDKIKRINQMNPTWRDLIKE